MGGGASQDGKIARYLRACCDSVTHKYLALCKIVGHGCGRAYLSNRLTQEHVSQSGILSWCTHTARTIVIVLGISRGAGQFSMWFGVKQIVLQ